MNYMKVLVLSVLCATNFLSHGMDPSTTTEQFWQAIRKGSHDWIKCYLPVTRWADINVQDMDGCTPLVFACKSNCGIARALIKAGADVNIVGPNSESPLTLAVKVHFFNKGKIALVKALVKAGADVNVRDEQGEALLTLVVKFSIVEIVKILVDNGSTQIDEAFLLAANTYYFNYDYTQAHSDIINILINAGAHSTMQSTEQCSVKKKNITLINELIEKRANTIAHNTPYSDDQYYTSLLDTFIKNSTNLHEQDLYGNTLLIIASMRNNTDSALALIKAGADVNSVNKDGETALLYAVKNKNTELVNVLIKAGVNVDSVYRGIFSSDYDSSRKKGIDPGDTALLYAVRDSNIAVVKALVEAGANINIKNRLNETALSCAIKSYRVVKSERAGLIKALIEPSAGKCDVSMLELAIKSKQPEMIMDLINPVAKPLVRKKIETLLMVYRKECSRLSLLPQELLKVIITCAHPEYAMDHQVIRCLHPQILVDTIPLENLAMLIEGGTLNQDAILGAWQNKITSIVQSLKAQKTLTDKAIQQFATDALTKITMLLTIK